MNSFIFLMYSIATFWSSPAITFAQSCDPVNFGNETVVCRCNSTYCDYYPDPSPPSRGQYIMYSTSRDGQRLARSDGLISNDVGNGFTVRIKSSQEYQRIHGFGGSFSDSATINIKNLSSAAQSHLMRSYFTVNGSKYNLGRVPIAGTDFSTRAYTYDEVDDIDPTLQRFALAREDTDFKIPSLKAALALNPELRLMSAAWTAPLWMKNIRRYNGYTHLDERYYQVYADYIVRFLEEYRERGVNMWAVSTGNEPYSSLIPNNPINSMYVSAENASNWILHNLVPTLRKSRSNATHILLYDDSRTDLLSYVSAIRANYSEVLEYVHGIAVHWYADANISPDVLVSAQKLVPDKFILMTESCLGFLPSDNPRVVLGSWSRTETLVSLMIENFNNRITGWVEWNLALNIQGGPSWIENSVDASIIIDAERDVFYKQPYYYAIAHFSKFVLRNSVKIQAKSNNDTILTTAFRTNDGQKVVILYNSNNRTVNCSVIHDGIGNINVELPAKSVHTILYDN